MEDVRLDVCKICKSFMVDPIILPCDHNFCLKCLECLANVLKESSECPTCHIEFQIPEGGLKDLKKSESIERLDNTGQNDIKCDSCSDNQAVKYCADCSFNYCSNCLVPHGRIPITSKHPLQAPSPSKHEVKVVRYSTCEEHLELMNLFCLDCNAILCCLCFTLRHNTHKMDHISHHIDSMKQKIQENLDLKAKVLKDVNSNYKTCEDMACNNDLIACKLKKDIQQRGEDMKNVIDSIVDELIGNVDKDLKQCQNETNDMMEDLKHLERNLQEQIETLKQQFNGLNCNNVLEMSSQKHGEEETANKNGIMPKYPRKFKMSLFYGTSRQRTYLEKTFGTLRGGIKFELDKEFVLDNLCHSFSLNPEYLFFCIEGSIVDIFSYDGLNLSSTFEFDNEISKVLDVLVVNRTLLVSGLCGYNVIKVMKVETSLKDQVTVIYKSEQEGSICNLARSFCGNILLVLCNELKVLSEEGTVIESVNLPFDICDALPLDRDRYVVCGTNKELCVVDKGHLTMKYSHLNKLKDIKSPFCLAKDAFGNIYVGDIYGNVFVLNSDLKFLKSHVVSCSGNVRKMCYDEVRGALLILIGNFDNSSLLNFL